MKISMIGPVYPYRGGIAHYTTSLAIALKNAGHDLKLISFKRQYPAFLYPGETDKDPSINPIRVDAEYLLDPIYPWTWRQTAKVILKDGSDFVLIQWWTTFWGLAYGALACQLHKKARVVYLIHNVLPHENRVWDRWLTRLALRGAFAFIVQTATEQKRLLDLVPHAKISYCSHPVYQRFSDQVVLKEEARRQLNLPMDKPIFLFFGIIRPYKGLKYLIEAVAKADASVHLVVAGEFWENVDLYQKQVDALQLTKSVTILNKYLPNEEAHLFFSAADVLVAPYVGGTQSGVVELALGYELPVIVTDRILAGVAETDVPGLRAVPAGNIGALAIAMDELVTNPPNLPTTQSARDDWSRMVETIEGIQSR